MVIRRRLVPWFVARTKPRQESWAAENVARQGAEYYLPRLSVKECLFPGYLFVRTRDKQWRFLNSTYGLLHVVMLGDSPARLSVQDVMRIRELEGEDGMVILPSAKDEPALQAGDKLKVLEGPFKDLHGICSEMSARDRVRVLLSLFGRMTPVYVELSQVRKVDTDEPGEI